MKIITGKMKITAGKLENGKIHLINNLDNEDKNEGRILTTCGIVMNDNDIIKKVSIENSTQDEYCKSCLKFISNKYLILENDSVEFVPSPLIDRVIEAYKHYICEKPIIKEEDIEEKKEISITSFSEYTICIYLPGLDSVSIVPNLLLTNGSIILLLLIIRTIVLGLLHS